MFVILRDTFSDSGTLPGVLPYILPSKRQTRQTRHNPSSVPNYAKPRLAYRTVRGLRRLGGRLLQLAVHLWFFLYRYHIHTDPVGNCY